MRKLIRIFAAAIVATVIGVGMGSTSQAAPPKLCWLTGNLDCH